MDVFLAVVFGMFAVFVGALVWREWRREEPDFCGQRDEPVITEVVVKKLMLALGDEEIECLLDDADWKNGYRPVVFLPRKRKVYYTSNSKRRLAGKAIAVNKRKGFLLRRLHHRQPFWRKPEDVTLAA